MKARCIDPIGSLVKGQVYEVRNHNYDEGHYLVKLNGDEEGFYRYRFEIIKEEGKLATTVHTQEEWDKLALAVHEAEQEREAWKKRAVQAESSLLDNEDEAKGAAITISDLRAKVARLKVLLHASESEHDNLTQFLKQAQDSTDHWRQKADEQKQGFNRAMKLLRREIKRR